MRPLILLLALLSLHLLPHRAHGDAGHDGRAGLRARVVAQAQALVGIREQGFNRGREVEALIKEAGGRIGDAYCSWTVVVILRRCAVLVPRFGKARAWFDQVHTIFRAGQALPGRPSPQPGDLLGFTWGHADICHVELLIVWGSGPSCRAVGGNTGGGGALLREGEGIYQNWRLKRMVTVANVIDNPHYK